MQGIFQIDEMKVAQFAVAPPLCVATHRGWTFLTTTGANGASALVLKSNGQADHLYAVDVRPDASMPIVECAGLLRIEALREPRARADVRGEAIGLIGINESGFVFIGKWRDRLGFESPAPISLTTGQEMAEDAQYRQVTHVLEYWRLLRQPADGGEPALIAERQPPAD